VIPGRRPRPRLACPRAPLPPSPAARGSPAVPHPRVVVDLPGPARRAGRAALASPAAPARASPRRRPAPAPRAAPTSSSSAAPPRASSSSPPGLRSPRVRCLTGASSSPGAAPTPPCPGPARYPDLVILGRATARLVVVAAWCLAGATSSRGRPDAAPTPCASPETAPASSSPNPR